MLRLVFVLLAAVVALLVGLSLLPRAERDVPDASLRMEGADVTLYPQADPAAEWSFRAPEVVYDPERRETTLFDLQDGARHEDGELDFALRADRMVIDGAENLRSGYLRVRLVDSGDCLVMDDGARGGGPTGGDGEAVLIDQREGTFHAPTMRIQGTDWGDTRFPNVVASFDLERFDAGGAGTDTVTEFYIEGDGPGRTECDDF